MPIKWAVGFFWRRRLACEPARAIADPRIGFRTLGFSKLGNLDRLYGSMIPVETVSKPSWTPAPYLALAADSKQGLGTTPHQGSDPTSLRCGLDFTGVESLSHRRVGGLPQ